MSPLPTRFTEGRETMRVQLALNVNDIDEAVAFYSKLFDAEVDKRKPGYANFSIDEPPLKLVLFESPGAEERLNHLGVEVFDDADVHADRCAGADAFEHAFLQHTEELGLNLGRHFADLIEQERAVVGQFEAALAEFLGAGEGPLFVAEEFGLEK